MTGLAAMTAVRIQLQATQFSAKRIIERMEEFYADFGESVHDCLSFQRRKFEEPESRYAWKIREQYGQGFVARGLQLARQRQREYLEE